MKYLHAIDESKEKCAFTLQIFLQSASIRHGAYCREWLHLFYFQLLSLEYAIERRETWTFLDRLLLLYEFRPYGWLSFFTRR